MAPPPPSWRGFRRHSVLSVSIGNRKSSSEAVWDRGRAQGIRAGDRPMPYADARCRRSQRKIFLLMLGIGFDAHVVDQVHSQRKGHVKRMDYWAAIARSIWSYRFPELRYTILDNDSDRRNALSWGGKGIHQFCVRWIFIVNLPLYASGLQMAPWASAQDGKLDVCTFRGGGLLQGIGYLLALRLRRQTQLRDFKPCPVESYGSNRRKESLIRSMATQVVSCLFR